MPPKESNEKISGNEVIFKELGSLQEKVLFFLAENPENHKQAIQQGIQHPSEQYGSVLKAVDTLEKLEFLESKEIKSQKNVQIKIYNCTELGVFYALTRNSDANILKVLDAYKSRIEFCKSFQALYDVWGHDHFAMFLRDMGEFLPMVQKNGVELAMPYLFLKIAKQMQSLDPKTKKKNVKEALKQYPQTKQMLKEIQKNINELL
jgi:DNA-binding PadR family transcriptional regulator